MSLVRVLPYVFFLMIGMVAVTLFTSKQLSERLVSAGILPRSFLGFIPAILVALRVCGILLIIAGLVKFSADQGWLDAAILERYTLPTAMVIFGAFIVWMS